MIETFERNQLKVKVNNKNTENICNIPQLFKHVHELVIKVIFLLAVKYNSFKSVFVKSQALGFA